VTAERLRIGFQLDYLWYLMRGETQRTKERALRTVARVLTESGTPYAIGGGLALQVHQQDPRTAIVIEIAVAGLESLPRTALGANGCAMCAEAGDSEHWIGPDAIAIRFRADAHLRPALARAITVDLDGQPLKVIGLLDFVRARLRDGDDRSLRRGMRLQALADAFELVEENPDLRSEMTPDECVLLDSIAPKDPAPRL
jgi:hypothetical protein